MLFLWFPCTASIWLRTNSQVWPSVPGSDTFFSSFFKVFVSLVMTLHLALSTNSLACSGLTSVPGDFSVSVLSSRDTRWSRACSGWWSARLSSHWKKRILRAKAGEMLGERGSSLAASWEAWRTCLCWNLARARLYRRTVLTVSLSWLPDREMPRARATDSSWVTTSERDTGELPSPPAWLSLH